MPSSRQTPITSFSGARVQWKYSDCNAVMGWAACARRIVVAPASEKTKEAHFAFLNEFRHCANGLLDWRVWIDAMLVVEINHIHTEPAQTAVASFVNIIGLAADAAVIRPGWVAEDF